MTHQCRSNPVIRERNQYLVDLLATELVEKKGEEATTCLIHAIMGEEQ